MQRRWGQFLLTGILTSLLIIIGCTAKSPQTQLTKGEEIFSNRPFAQGPQIVVVTLKQPPLLQTATRQGSQLKLVAEQIEKVSEEHKRFRQQLSALSPDFTIIYEYRLVLNGFAILAPPELVQTLRTLPEITRVEHSQMFSRPQQEVSRMPDAGSINEINSVTFIGADRVHSELRVPGENGVEQRVDGTGITVGIIDTGIDYTHSMMGGSGSAEVFKAINPAQPNSAFPNQKVTGGIDLVGSDYNAASPLVAQRIPTPDANPIDEAGHGTHVGGTVAGFGDGVNTYSGVAPQAKLHAIKVFGKEGSTDDFVVIAGFEYAADPNGDLNLQDQINVVNLSLGGGFGLPNSLYTEAVTTLSNAGTVVVASAGNSGSVDYIVGAPSTSDEAISVAASVDGSLVNWQFLASIISAPGKADRMVRAVEGSISKPVAEVTVGEKIPMVFIGLGDQDLDQATKDKLKGKVALMDRGKVTFSRKVQVAFEAGAVGVVVANNTPGEPFAMGGDGHFEIPAIMISQELGEAIKKELATETVTIAFNSGQNIEEPNLIDTLADFTSKGPRSEDNLFKPEISAPGVNILSAEMGSGAKGVRMSGTSMAAPHIAGVVALLKQYRPSLSSNEVKGLLMSTGKFITDKSGQKYPFSLQGAGRVQVYEAATNPLIFSPTSISLGQVQIDSGKRMQRQIMVKNATNKEMTVAINYFSGIGFGITGPENITVPANSSRSFTADIQFTRWSMSTEEYLEYNGAIEMTAETQKLHLPVLAIRTPLQRLVVDSLTVHSGSKAEALSAKTDLKIRNDGLRSGTAYVFNLLGTDLRKPAQRQQVWMSRSCDLQSAGYRVVQKSENNQINEVLQVAFKLYNPLSTWDYCDVSVLIDANEDGLADQELAGFNPADVEGLSDQGSASMLLDAQKARELRLAYEHSLTTDKPIELSYASALLGKAPFVAFRNSTIAIVEMPISKLWRTPLGYLRIKVATIHNNSDSQERDDFLGGDLLNSDLLNGDLDQWHTINLSANGSGYSEIPEKIVVPSGKTETLTLIHGDGQYGLVAYFPYNMITPSSTQEDQQSFIPKAVYNP